MTLGPFPTHDEALNLLEHSLDGAYEVEDDGTHRLVRAEFSLNQLLDFYSGYDPEQVNLLHHTDDGIPVYEYTGGCLYHEHDVIRALIAEVRRLRAAQA